jgi:hypothetical protein
VAAASPAPAAAPEPALATAPMPTLFGIGETGTPGQPSEFDEIRTKLTTTLSEFADALGTALKNLVEDVSTLEVATYVTADLGTVHYDGDTHAFTGPVQQRALTCIRFGGDTLILVPESNGLLDERLWAVHMSMVERAQANRTEMIRAAASAAAGLVTTLKPA